MDTNGIYLKQFFKIITDDSIHYITPSMNPEYFILVTESSDVEVMYLTKEQLIEIFPILDKKLERYFK